jgi:ParB family chromosome partitioning protein
MARDIKTMLAQKLAENSKRHSEASQEPFFDAGRQHVKLPVDQIDPNPYQPRRTFPQAELESLASSIAETGLLQPISVRTAGHRYQIIAGERRWRAHKLIGRPSIEALVIPAEDGDMAILALAENIDREDLSDYEIGKALRQVEDTFPTKKKLAEALGMNREDMYRYFAFEALPENILSRLDENPRLLSRSAATEIKRVLQQAQNQELARRLLDEAWGKLEAGKLEQTKLAGQIAQGLRICASPPAQNQESPQTRNLTANGKLVGSISADGKALVVKLKAQALSNEKRERLIQFIEDLMAEEV